MRYLAFVGAFVITAGIYVLMDRMISRDRTRLLNVVDAQTVEFVRTPLDEQTRTKDRRRKPPPKPKEIKRVRPDVVASVNRAATLPQDFAAYDVKSLLGEGGGIALGQSLVEGRSAELQSVLASDLTSLAKLPPQYPQGAVLRKIEGWVRLRFLVTEEGLTRDVEVIEATPQGIFNAAATVAVQRWRFKPVIKDGLPTPVIARVKIEFTLPGN